jgi:hypothetical protein
VENPIGAANLVLLGKNMERGKVKGLIIKKGAVKPLLF